MVYYESFFNRMRPNVKYSLQLDERKAAIARKRPELANWRGVVLHHDNTSLCIEVQPIFVPKLLHFKWGVLPHPPHAFTFALFDCYLVFFFTKVFWEYTNRDFGRLQNLD